MISEKIELIKKINFVPKKVIDWNAEIKDNPNRNFSISIPFTSNRCQKIENKLRKIIKSITLNLNINFCWRNIKLSQLITPKTKPATPKLECAGTVYKFKCFCKICYMGESQRPLIKRIAEHSQRSSKSAITKHIYSCPAYLDALKRKFGEIPTRDTKYFLAECFSIMENNLSNYYDRTLIEALAITFFKPPLNEQVSHKAVAFI